MVHALSDLWFGLRVDMLLHAMARRHQKKHEGRGGVGLCQLLRVRRGVGKNGSTICEHR